jgi:predicted transcriptional regulator
MARRLPSRSDPDVDAVPRVVGLDDAAENLLSALSSATTRRLLAALHDEPTNPASLADSADTSLQNAQYHLDRLESAGVIEVIDTVYSEKGREMDVYAPADQPLVVVAADEDGT